jgi:CHAT domain-containing protein/Tfp pilus assembly protein PilF
MSSAAEQRRFAGAWALVVGLSWCSVLSVLHAEGPGKAPTPEERQALQEKAQQLNGKLVKAYQDGRLDDALDCAREMLRIFEQLYPTTTHPDGHRDLAATINNLGNVLLNRGDYARAQPLFERALAMNEKLYPLEHFPDGHTDLAASINSLGALLQYRGDYAHAQPLYERALAMTEKLYPLEHFPNGHLDLARSINNLGALLQYRGDYAHAQPHLERALAMYEKLYPKERFPSGHPHLASSINNLGALLEARGDYTRAQPLFERALAMNEKLYPKERFPSGHPELARSLHNLGMLLRASGDYTHAQPHLERALAMREKLYPKERFPNGHPELAWSIDNLGMLLQLRGDYARAQPHLERALAMREKLYPKERFPNGHPDLATSLHNLGVSLQYRGDYARAQPFFERSLAIREKLYPKERFPSGHPELAASIKNLGILLKTRGDYARAQPLFERALAMYEKLYPKERFPNGHTGLARSLNDLGGALQARGDYAGAQAYDERALAMNEKLYPKERFPNGHLELAASINNLGFLLLARGDSLQAQPHLDRAVQMFDRLAAELVRSGSEAEALNFAATLPLTRDGYLSLAHHLPAAPQRDYALLWQSKAALTRVLTRRQGLLRTSALPAEARHKADRLADLRRQRQTILLAVAAADTRERDRRLRDLNEEIDTLDRDLLRLVPALRRSDELVRRSPDDLCKVLSEKSAFIDLLRYVHIDRDPDKSGHAGRKRPIEYVGFVVSKDRVQRVELGEARPIETAVAAWREAITDCKAASPTAQRERDAAAAKQARKLRELVWNKLAEHLPRDVQTVYLSPDGDLTQVPWAALPGRKPDSILLEDHAIAVVPHGPFLLDMLTPDPARHEVDQALLAVGDVRYDDRPATADVASRGADDTLPARLWPQLKATVREIENVRGLADKQHWKVQPLTGTDAGSAALLKALPQARVAHLATHGFFADSKFRSVLQLDEKLFEKRFSIERGIAERIGEAARSPLLLSGLVLAGANLPETPGRGIVTAEALVGLDLSGLQLAVLSACETGLGEVAGGEGVFGLQRAFHLAGTRNVVASLWQVDDEATAALMVLFYRYLWQDKLPPVQALRQAQLAVYHHPEWVSDYASGKRAPRPFKTVEVTRPDPPETTPPDGIKRAPVHRWAAFVLSGPGNAPERSR